MSKTKKKRNKSTKTYKEICQRPPKERKKLKKTKSLYGSSTLFAVK